MFGWMKRRPRNQGSKLTAWELGQHGVPHTVIADNAGGHLMQHGKVDVVIVGTDRTTSTGDVANKIGTYLKALAAKDNGVPFYVALPSSSFDWSIRDGLKEIPIEERGSEEVNYADGWARWSADRGAGESREYARRQLWFRCDPATLGNRADHGARNLSGKRREHSRTFSRARPGRRLKRFNITRVPWDRVAQIFSLRKKATLVTF